MSAPPLLRYDGRPRLLGGWLATGRAASLAEHTRVNGPLPLGAVRRLPETVTSAGLRGRGGAWFPTGRKLKTVARNGRAAGGSHVVVNGAESEPAAGKDKLLLGATPHLVLDGAELAALAVGATKVTVCVHRGTGLARTVEAAIAERAAAGWGGASIGLSLAVLEPPRWYVSSESTALANFVGGGEGKPRDVSAYREGVGGKPTLVSNTETLAHLGLIARHGPDWFRMAGTGEAPGTALFTVSGAVRARGVYELPVGVTGNEILRVAGGATEPLQAVLVGGYGGSWMSPGALAAPFTPEALAPLSASPGAGVVVALPVGACGLVETVRVAAWLASQNARQCGPCFNGLPAIADDLARVTWARDRTALDRLRFRMNMVNGRGACAHPDGVVKLASTALRVFGACVDRHLHGQGCPGLYRPPMLPVPAPPSPSEGWK
ncbi:MAG TPA: NADH-ubiquinone oxidoreductase-F iron-sulfur binding region domain-containing protein [Actinophytocola sp.]|uniref:NADH-ubiquinone oxidoreductase-F iron-sulfur binding region domain-containing protein n=1 Tax=Actinophytocola sp. TaxID=1872138 RepID=UPI002DBE0FCA|nr:NADH-ubiquinone oxidoreductase-F iron-sulfur binding region domain-containing protein [Actinophytocola sp.]HEU5473151.1 NADH-ubiquinone oxidoreductase-F iron-sulfur binding region domain-containing protein [Actinophytocola sp.]